MIRIYFDIIYRIWYGISPTRNWHVFKTHEMTNSCYLVHKPKKLVLMKYLNCNSKEKKKKRRDFKY